MDMRKFILIGVLLGIVFLGCEERRYSWEIDDEKIREYLKDTGLDEVAIKHETGFYYIIEEEGTGKTPNISNHVSVNYLGYYTDSTIFDQGEIRSPLSGLYVGWQYGIPLFKEGGKGKLFLPRSMADQYSVMIFEVELLSVW